MPQATKGHEEVFNAFDDQWSGFETALRDKRPKGGRPGDKASARATRTLLASRQANSLTLTGAQVAAPPKVEEVATLRMRLAEVCKLRKGHKELIAGIDT